MFPGTQLTPAETELEAHGIKLWHVTDTVHAFGIMAWLGYSIGENALEVRQDRMVEKILHRFADTKVKIIANTVYQDEDGACRGSKAATVAEWVAELVNWGLRDLWGSFNNDHFEKTIVDMASLKKAIRSDYYDYSGDVHCISVNTSAEQVAADKLAKRRELESAARDLAHRAGVEIDSLEFIRVCERELERYEDYRYGMEEDGLCIGYGVTADQWFEERNASRSDTNHVRDILDWLSSNCPMLWAEYQEAVRSGRWNDEDSDESEG